MHTIDRLIHFFVPDHYELSIAMEREARTFHGTVVISGKSLAKHIKLHAKELTIRQAHIDGKEVVVEQQDDELTLSHPDLALGQHLITLSFDGKITDPMHGLYPCYYQHDGVPKELLATQFESHHAREVFPCIDEPEAKASFDVTLTTEQGVTVLGNMPVKNQRLEDGMLVTQFERSPRMSTYLLAWVVGELQKKTTMTQTGTEVSVWATPAQPAASLDFALDIASRTIDFFNEYFETPYPLPKSDHVALPDFSSGAMENWGLITYREVALLADPATASIENKRQVALVVAHELSHQWFGNLVTMRWWNDLWLNESFANMMEYVAIDALEPDWQVWMDHASYEVIQALRRDSMDGVQSIQTDVHHPDEISALFDPSIVYAKGGRLLRMLQTYIGNDALQAGLKRYFKQYAYQNTTADDLWECLSEASGKDIVSLMDAWIKQSGYPVVSVYEKEGVLHLEQEQFFIGDHDPSTKKWPIPLASTDSRIPGIMTEKTLSVPYDDDQPPILNHNSASHYIVDYSDSLRKSVLATLDQQSEIDRLKVLNEHLLLAQAQRISSASLFDLLDHFREETNEAVWGVMSLAINELKKFTEDDEDADRALRSYVKHLASKQYQRLGWVKQEGEDENDTKLRSLIVSLMLYGEDDDAQSQATAFYLEAEIEQLDADLRPAIMAHAVRKPVSDSVIDDLLRAHHQTNSSELREDIAAALTATRSKQVAEQLLSLLKDPSQIRPQDVTRWFVWLLRNRYTRETAWQWVRQNWDWLERTFGSDKSYDAYPRYIASILTKKQHLHEYEQFFQPLSSQPALKRNIEVGVVELQHRVELLDQEGPAVRKRLLELNES